MHFCGVGGHSGFHFQEDLSATCSTVRADVDRGWRVHRQHEGLGLGRSGNPFIKLLRGSMNDCSLKSGLDGATSSTRSHAAP